MNSFGKLTPYKERVINENTKVQCYRNLHKDKFSIKEKNGKVLAHGDNFILDCSQPHYLPSGQKKALETGVRNVHASLEGYLIPNTEKIDTTELEEISYNPFKEQYFYYKNSKKEFLGEKILFFKENKVFVLK